MKKNLLIKVIYCFLFLFLFHSCNTEDANQDNINENIANERLDAYFSLLEKEQNFSGSVAIMKNNKIIYSRSVGYADKDKMLNSDKTKYRVGSISKTFTSVLVMKSIEEGKLKLEDKLDIFFPQIENAHQISISLLLEHRSGIHNVTDDPDFLNYFQEPKSEAEMIDMITKAGSDFLPDSKFSYSNSNYMLLTYILEKVNKKSYANLVDEKIVKLIGLTNTYVGGKINPDKNEAFSYLSKNYLEKDLEIDMSIPSGSGAIVSNPFDLAKFSNSLFNGQLLKKESMKKMTSLKPGYGYVYGLYVLSHKNILGFGHGGNIDSFSSLFGHYEKDNINFAVVSNTASGYYELQEIGKILLNAAYNEPFDVISLR